MGSFKYTKHNLKGYNDITNLHIWKWKTTVSHAFQMHFIFGHLNLQMSHPFHNVNKNGLTYCVDDMTTWWQMFNFIRIIITSLKQSGSNLIPGLLEHILQAINDFE